MLVCVCGGVCAHIYLEGVILYLIKHTTVCVCVSTCWLSIVVNDHVNQSLGQLSSLYRFKPSVSHRYISAEHERVQQKNYICIKHNSNHRRRL